ncbi:hypothetical protein lbkm_2191 [Lachnospiraceae bacterium KM106-2]|nr:hypothetical protein lbkm_2191 [Lachnospiraceae bacterium KM106-2]
MRKTINDYWEVIKKLPLKAAYTKEELLIPELLLEKEHKIEIYYAPHNEYINPKAKVFIVGITPGFQQMSTAIAAARQGIEQGETIQEIQYHCKREGRFSGSLRRNIITMLDEIHLDQALGLDSCSHLFGEEDDLLHTVSLIPYSVFVNGGNYSGHTPKLLKSDFLMKYIYENFMEEYHSLEEPEKILIIPLGRAVEDVLLQLGEEGKLQNDQILRGFPHPSGANVNRLTQLRENKELLIKQIEQMKERYV